MFDKLKDLSGRGVQKLEEAVIWSHFGKMEDYYYAKDRKFSKLQKDHSEIRHRRVKTLIVYQTLIPSSNNNYVKRF